MSLFNKLTAENKKQAIEQSMSQYQAVLYALLSELGIDPDSFDETTWDTPLNMETPTGRVRYYIDTIKGLDEKFRSI